MGANGYRTLTVHKYQPPSLISNCSTAILLGRTRRLMKKSKIELMINKSISSRYFLLGPLYAKFITAAPADMQLKHNSQHETALIAHGTIEWASLFHIMCLCSTTTRPPTPPPPCILQGVWPSLCCQSPPNTQEASIQ